MTDCIFSFFIFRSGSHCGCNAVNSGSDHGGSITLRVTILKHQNIYIFRLNIPCACFSNKLPEEACSCIFRSGLQEGGQRSSCRSLQRPLPFTFLFSGWEGQMETTLCRHSWKGGGVWCSYSLAFAFTWIKCG